ncbi:MULTISPECIES: endolytic transglycosylase MltG [Corallococcus]|uniref:endolytic transglycosylase MltG n=1 Tax=Corallococcus TaxID=83461 RepID=UPI00117DD074|nr:MULTISPECIES: endolytic transglycosylase MltG [Corallococcus]NBD09437.1 endolytic transglycosylase MltG [Corallococcus silvisoli]TSC31394.1 endolytic transglycosylase MltG [Corallococcus sp. Z5C101001]
MKKILVALLVLGVLAVAGVGGVFVSLQKATVAPHPAADPAPKEFIVKKGASARSLGQQLQAQGFLDNATVWRFHLWRRGSLNVKAGRFLLSPTASVEELATALEGSPLPEDVPFAMIEGWRLRDTDQMLASQGLIKPGDYIAAATHPEHFTAPFPLPSRGLEGYLYPETYGIIADNFRVDAFIQRQIDTFRARFYDAHQEEIAKSGRSLHDIVVMASMLEREEPVPSQRALVAGILWKRVDKGFPLGVDATSRYELAEWNDRKAFLKRLRDNSDPWNSRTRAGLPPGPIGAPTVDSLLAALRPVKSDFWYYLHDAQRVLHPSRNAQEHEALRAKYNVY